MKLETFSYLPEFTEAEVEAQIRSILDQISPEAVVA